jgi:hypothetical protein
VLLPTVCNWPAGGGGGQQVATTLVGTVRRPEMEQNLDVLLNGLSEARAPPLLLPIFSFATRS